MPGKVDNVNILLYDVYNVNIAHSERSVIE